MRPLQIICKFLFSTTDTSLLKDIRLWLLLIGINIGANLGFNYVFHEQRSLPILFSILVVLIPIKKYIRDGRVFTCLIPFLFIILIQPLYLPFFPIVTTIHYVLMISVASMLVVLCGKDFPRMFSGIIFCLAIISLVCYIYVYSGGTIPFYHIDDTLIDDGYIMRVYNIYYTQLGNPIDGFNVTRNCGPFWEPGAFQGFLNLSLWFELTYNRERDIYWRIRIIVFIITILTTLSTGGYVALFVVLFFYLLTDKHHVSALRFVWLVLLLVIAVYLSLNLSFLWNKIATDEARLVFNFSDFPNLLYALFGYGYSPEVFHMSSISSASSVYNLFRYIGVFGFLGYILPLLNNRTPYKFFFFVIICTILMNEPFLSHSLIWWGMPLVCYEKF